MPMFEFTLKKFEQTIAFNNKPTWYWLSDGSYNIVLAGKRLLTYTPDDDAEYYRWCAESGMPPDEPDYYVQDFYAGLQTDLLPALQYCRSELEHQILLNPRAYKVLDEQWAALPDTAATVYENVCAFGMFCVAVALPLFRAWRYADDVYVYWNGNRRDTESGEPLFREQGEAVFVMPYARLLDEIWDFHRRYFAAMEEYVRLAKPYYPFEQACVYPDGSFSHMLRYDYEDLLTAQEYERRELQNTLNFLCSPAGKKCYDGNCLPRPDFEQNHLAYGINLRKILRDCPCDIPIIRI